MQYTLEIKEGRHDTFSSIAKKNGGGKTLGQADFWRDTKRNPAVWKARVDLKTYLQIGGQGIATAILAFGDAFIRQHYPNDLRAFEDLNGYSYKRYTDQIGDDQLVSFEKDELLFKP